MDIIGILLWVVAIWLALAFAWNLRRMVWRGTGLMIQTANFALLLVVQTILVSSLGLSPLHFIWMTPIAFFIGQMTILFPFSLISPLGRLYASLCCLGLNDEEVRMNHARLEYAKELLSSGYSQQDAMQMAREKFPVANS